MMWPSGACFEGLAAMVVGFGSELVPFGTADLEKVQKSHKCLSHTLKSNKYPANLNRRVPG
jgi:hypothetical protein